KCPELYQTQLQDHLPSLDKPRVLDKDNWAQFLAKIETTDLSQVEVIRGPCSDPDRWFLSLWKNQSSFLQRCRNLRELEMISLGSETFAWATRESHMSGWDHSKNINYLMAQLNRFIKPTPLTPPTQPLHPHVPIEHLRLWSYWTPIKNEIIDILASFSDTLVTLIVRDANQLAINTPLLQPPTEGSLSKVVFGLIFRMTPSKLRKIIVVLPKQEIVLPEYRVSSYPDLEYLEMEDGLSRYSCDSTLPKGATIDWDLIKSDVLANKSIKLLGRPALCFQPRTLYHTPDLRVLHLGTRLINGQSYIPPVEEILRYEFDSKDQEIMEFRARADDRRRNIAARPTLKRPYWSWDWNLPNLQTLHLIGEFAWRFKFKMLVGCPNLENLILNMATIGDNGLVTEPEDRQDGDQNGAQQDQPVFEHQRNIQARDFLLPIDGDETHDSENYIQNLNLKLLYIGGRWFLSGEALQVMLLSVMPNLQTLLESQCLGFTIGAWVGITGQLTSLKTASSTRIVNEERLAEVGLAKYVQDPDMTPRYTVVEENVDGEIQRRFVVVPDEISDSNRQSPMPIYTFSHRGEYIKSA
ncbi:hypothetical protein BGX26_008597, partial [Mortierella sp. AD094]